MISKKMTQQLNEQMKNEFYSAYLYLAMSTWFTSKSLTGFAHWFNVQAQEERDHAKLIMNYLLRVGAKAEFLPIEAPKADFKNPLDICKKTLAHEQLVTSMIYKLMDTAQEERDYKTIQFLQWFVLEQTEEEENAQDLIDKLNLAGEADGAVLYIDGKLAARSYTPATSAF